VAHAKLLLPGEEGEKGARIRDLVDQQMLLKKNNRKQHIINTSQIKVGLVVELTARLQIMDAVNNIYKRRMKLAGTIVRYAGGVIWLELDADEHGEMSSQEEEPFMIELRDCSQLIVNLDPSSIEPGSGKLFKSRPENPDDAGE
jgi:hypothetical protein